MQNFKRIHTHEIGLIRLTYYFVFPFNCLLLQANKVHIFLFRLSEVVFHLQLIKR